VGGRRPTLPVAKARDREVGVTQKRGNKRAGKVITAQSKAVQREIRSRGKGNGEEEALRVRRVTRKGGGGG